jgi:hypothetical protein
MTHPISDYEQMDEQHQEAYLRGLRAGRAQGAESLAAYSPYDPDDQKSLDDAWEKGFDDSDRVAVFNYDQAWRIVRIEYKPG